MKAPLMLSLLLLLTSVASAQVVPMLVIVRSNKPVVDAFKSLEREVVKKLTQGIANQRTQISRARALNRSIGDWGVGGPPSARLTGGTLAVDHTADLRASTILDYNTPAKSSFRTASNQSLTLDAADFTDYARIDQTGKDSRAALERIAVEIKATNQDIAATYAEMTKADPDRSVSGVLGSDIPDSNMSQQKYEKLRGKMQALHLHLQGLQAQQREVFGLLQGQATLTRNKLARDAEIAAQVQKANHMEDMRAFTTMRFGELDWR